MLKRCGILKEILPEVDCLDMVDQSPRWHLEGDVWIHTMDALTVVRNQTNGLDILWGTLLHDIGKARCTTIIDNIIKHPLHEEIGREMAIIVMGRLKVSTPHKDAVVDIVGSHMRIKQADKMKLSKVRRLMASPHFKKIKLASWADSKAAVPENTEDGKNKFNWMIKLDEVQRSLKDEVVLPTCLIGGKDLMVMGLKPSPKFGEILTHIMNLQLEGKVCSKEEAIAVARRMV